ncbi:MAG TPA: NAD(P)-binding domain-containing protein [Chitinophagaceae bacterium]|nr:NAD(P)-binding domain-containing protein [Chitinophagaceae bacterium]
MHTKLLIIGAGPYGLSLAAFAKRHGIDFIIVGEPMGFWKNNMPENMLLRSGIDWHLDPFNQYTLRSFLQQTKAGNFSLPVTRQIFLDYAAWFIQQYNIQAANEIVTALYYDGTAYSAALANGGSITARYVVIATGFSYCQNLPQVITQNLLPQYYSHTCNTVAFEFLRNKKCIIIGGRQSAFEWAALMLEDGCASVDILYGHDTPAFEPSDWDWVEDLLKNSLHNPGWFNSLPDEERAKIKHRFWAEGRLRLEPWLATRLQGKNITFWPLRHIQTVQANGETVTLHTHENDTITGNYVLLATGYAVNLDAVPFLAAGNLPALIQRSNGYPVLDEHFQCSLPGLFFTSFASTQNFGPFFGFVRGATVTAAIIGAYLAGRLNGKTM